MGLGRYIYRLAVSLREILSLPLNKATTLVLSTYTFLWGVWLVSPFWSVFDSAGLYSALNTVLPEVGWGFIAIGCGIAMSWGVIHKAGRWLTVGAYVGFLHWLTISGGYFVGDWQNTGGITALTIAILCALTYLNSRVNRDNLPLEEKQDKI